MKKEKKVRTYQRRTKSGKTITVRAHTASYEAADKAKEAAKKKGAGDEFSSKVKKGEEWKLPMNEFLDKLKEERAKKREDEEPKKVEDEKPKKKSEKKSEKKTPAKKATKKRTVGTGTNGPEPKKKATTKKTAEKADTSEPAFTRDEFKEWYRGTGSAADKKVAKALRKQLGRSGYRKFEDEAIDNYTSRGHLSMFKRVSGGSSTGGSRTTQKGKVSKPTLSKNMSENRSNASAQMKEYKKQLMSAIKDGNSKKIREARKGYMQAMDDSTFGGSKASKASAEKDYQSVVKALSKAGYDEQGYKKRSTKTSKTTKEFTESQLRAYGRKLVNARNKYIGGPGPDSYRRALKKRQEALAEYHKTDEGKAMRSAYRSYVSKKNKQWEKDHAERAAAKKLEDAKRYISEYEKKKSSSTKKRSVGTGTNGPEPKKAKTASAPSMKKELTHLLTGVNGSTLRTWNKQAKFLSRKDGTLEASADYSKMGSNLRKAGWKNIDTVSIVGGTSNFVSPDGKYHAVVGNRKTKIKPIKKGEKVGGHSWDSIFGGNDHSASRYD